MSAITTPNGLPEIIATFGDVHSFDDGTGVLRPEWNQQYLSQVALPFPIPLSWNPNQSASRITCHRLLAPVFLEVFESVASRGLQSQVATFGGCFVYRPQRGSGKLSTHAWGIAIDLNPATNQQGTDGNMNMDVIGIFRQAGFEWGGDWASSRRDPMHFQFATGY